MDYTKLDQQKTIKAPFFYGWVIVFIGSMGLFFSGPGQTYSVSVFINSYVDSFGWSRTMISSLYSAATLISGLTLSYMGKLIDKIGHRKMISVVPIILGFICLWMSFVANPMMIFVGFVFLRLFGQGTMCLIPYTLVPQWFIKRRGFALSLLAIGSVLGSAVFPPLNNWLIVNSGVGFAWRFWTILLIGVMAPLGWILVRNRPEDVGLLPDGENKFIEKNTFVESDTLERSLTLKEAMKTRTFWLMLFCMVIPSMINTGLIFHMVSMIEIKGFTSTFAASLLSITAIIQFPLTFLAGYLLDKIKVRYVKAVNYWVLISAMGVLLYAKNQHILFAYAVLNGVFVAFDSVSTGVWWPNYFGRKHLGSIRGFSMTAIVVGSALGPLPFGFAYDLFHGYKEIILLMMIIPALGSIAAFIASPPKYEK
ncbi:MFS transporter [Crassaminicella profunda]|uniref:MFS transporter n=1 Tax=Crassaminicella profunda TaxID=1286698 RepID=UPI001CA652AE|nr:MFS transporter [Crassaminicella profunda]QZY57267.1 MFS transporter [Crassaminicella profunda]